MVSCQSLGWAFYSISELGAYHKKSCADRQNTPGSDSMSTSRHHSRAPEMMGLSSGCWKKYYLPELKILTNLERQALINYRLVSKKSSSGEILPRYHIYMLKIPL